MKTLSILLALSLSTAAQASEIKWDSLSVSKQNVKNEHFENFRGHGFAATKLFNDSMILSVSKSSLDSTIDIFGYNVDLDYEVQSFGIGGKKSVSEKTDLYFVASYVDLKAKLSLMGYSGSESESTTALTVGIRSMVSPNFELSSHANFYDDSDIDHSITIGGHYYLSDAFSLGLDYEKDSESVGTSIIARLYF
jgi:hypothetical protein